MSYSTSIFAISETYDLVKRTCQIKDAIICRDYIIIRTTNIHITEEENTAVLLDSICPSGSLKAQVQLPKRIVANINISGEKYMLEHPVFINFYHNTNVINLCHSNSLSLNIFRDVISDLALITHFASNKLYFFCNIFNTNPRFDDPKKLLANSVLIASMPNIKLTIDDIVECGIFETDYINKLDASKIYINRNKPLYNLYNKYRPRYDAYLIEMQKIKNDADAFKKAKDDLKIANAENAQLKQEIQKIKNDHVILKAIEKEKFETTVNAEIKKIWETIALMQYKSSSHF